MSVKSIAVGFDKILMLHNNHKCGTCSYFTH
jgi:hypothetical protein